MCIYIYIIFLFTYVQYIHLFICETLYHHLLYVGVQGSSVHVKSGSFVHVRRWSSVHVTFGVILSLYLCNMILFVAVFSLHHHTTHHCVGFFLTSLCGVFAFRLAFRAFSSSSSVVPSLTQLPPSSLTQRTQLISHNSSPLTTYITYITHLTQLISHNSAHTTHPTQLISHN